MEEEEFTYAALRKVERQENTSPRLSKLEARFWEKLGEHLTKLRQAFQDQQEEDPTSRRTVVLADELRNTQRLAESIWSLREKKVVHAGLASTRKREGPTAPLEHTTPEERRLYETVVNVLQRARDEAAITDPFSRRGRDAVRATAPSRPVTTPGVAHRGDTATDVTQEEVLVASVPAAAHPLEAEIHVPARNAGPGRAVGGVFEAEAPAQADEGGGGVGASGGHEVALRLVQALDDVPQFAGPDLATYELARGEIGNLPVRAADLLEKKGVVRILPGA